MQWTNIYRNHYKLYHDRYRYTDPEPSDIDVRRRDDARDEKKYTRSREDLDKYRSPARESDARRQEKYREAEFKGR